MGQVWGAKYEYGDVWTKVVVSKVLGNTVWFVGLNGHVNMVYTDFFYNTFLLVK